MNELTVFLFGAIAGIVVLVVLVSNHNRSLAMSENELDERLNKYCR
jgi:hypothetical protein